MRSKILLTTCYFLLLATPVVTWLGNRAWQGGVFYSLVRLAGLVAFTLIFLQLVIGSLMVKLRPIFGSAVLRLHICQGIVAFILAWLHPLFLISQWGVTTVLGLGGYYLWGKVGLALLTLAVLAGLLRTRKFLARHWRWIHRLNYVTLAVIYIHSWNVGSDTHTFPMVILYYLIPPIAGFGLYTKLRGEISKVEAI